MRFISLRFSSLIALLLVLIPVYLIGNSFVSNQMELQLHNTQQKVKQFTNDGFNTLIQQSFVDIEILAEEIVFFQKLDTVDDSRVLERIESAFLRLQLNHPLRAVHIITQDGTQNTLGDFHSLELETMYEQLVKTKIPVHNIECQTECLLNVMVPLRVGNENWGLVLSSELTDIFVKFSRSNNIDAGLIMPENSGFTVERRWSDRSIPILTSSEKMMSVLDALSKADNRLQADGSTIYVGEEVFFVWSHHYKLESSTPLQTIFFSDLTETVQGFDNRFEHSVTFMLMILGGLFVAVLLLSSFPIRRLIKLTESIKHLGRKDYTRAISALEESNKTLVADEITEVQSSISKAASKLQAFESQLVESQTHLQYVATHDSVTDLLNRYAFSERFNELYQQKRSDSVSLLLVDIDDFNAMNDNLGHQTGDQILKSVGDRLQWLSDQNIEVYRYGGDEFMLICFDEKGSSQRVESLVKQLPEAFSDPIDVDGGRLPVSVSFGIAQNSRGDSPFSRLPAQVILALYEAKKSNHSLAWFSPAMESRANLVYRIKTDFERSLQDNEFSINYQPMISFGDAKLVKMEALVRWRHRELGPIFPDQFIPVLEDTGQIEPLTFWLVEEAINQIHTLDELGFSETKISINVSGQQVSDSWFIERVVAILQRHHVSPKRFELEITETSMVKDFQQAREWVCQAKAAGFEVAMDDFGTGYSSLSYLTSIDFDTVKLDRSLISDVTGDVVQQNVVKSMANMMAQLGLKVVVEGVEEYNQFTFLRNLKCDVAQGYLIAKPLDAQALKTVLQNYRSKEGWFDEAVNSE